MVLVAARGTAAAAPPHADAADPPAADGPCGDSEGDSDGLLSQRLRATTKALAAARLHGARADRVSESELASRSFQVWGAAAAVGPPWARQARRIPGPSAIRTGEAAVAGMFGPVRVTARHEPGP